MNLHRIRWRICSAPDRKGGTTGTWGLSHLSRGTIEFGSIAGKLLRELPQGGYVALEEVDAQTAAGRMIAYAGDMTLMRLHGLKPRGYDLLGGIGNYIENGETKCATMEEAQEALVAAGYQFVMENDDAAIWLHRDGLPAYVQKFLPGDEVEIGWHLPGEGAIL